MPCKGPLLASSSGSAAFCFPRLFRPASRKRTIPVPPAADPFHEGACRSPDAPGARCQSVPEAFPPAGPVVSVSRKSIPAKAKLSPGCFPYKGFIAWEVS